MKICDLFKDVECELWNVSPDIDVAGITCDSRRVEKNTLFIAVKGEDSDGHSFVADAARRGAAAICVTGKYAKLGPVPLVIVKDNKDLRFLLASRFYGHPEDGIEITGITGTNGKTTTAHILYSVLNFISRPTGLIGTIAGRIGPCVIPSENTTPGPVELERLFKEMADRRIARAVMEVSSHALKQGRVAGLRFKAAVMTNVTGDHLDYHKTFEDYLAAKTELFSSLSPGSIAVLNRDDLWYEHVRAKTKAAIVTYGIKNRSDVMARDIKMDPGGTSFTLKYGEVETPVRTHLLGEHNVYNMLAAVSVLVKEGVGLQAMAPLLSRITGPEGRLEPVRCGQPFTVLVDYAHTTDALKRLLEAVGQVFHGHRVLVFGCGGDRDRGKRPEMGAVAARLADEIILTSDNPRKEDPKTIIDDIVSGIPDGFSRYRKIPDRGEAIAAALEGRSEAEVVIIAGKGHESCQVIGESKLPFNDRKVVEEILCSHARIS